MNEVSTVTFGFFEAAARRGVIRLEDLLQGIPVPLERLRDPNARLDWDTFAALCDRFETLAGGPSASPELGTYIIESTAASAVRKLTGLFTSSEALYAAVVRWYAPSQCRNIRFAYREHGKRRIEVTAEIPPEYRDCPAYFRLLGGAFRALPRLSGQLDAIVETHIEPRRVVYTILTPPDRSLVGRLSRLGKVLGAARGAVDELSRQEKEIVDGYHALLRSQRDFRNVIDCIPDGIAIHRGGVLLYVNPAWASHLGRTEPEALIGTRLLDAILPADRDRVKDRLEAREEEPASGPIGEIHLIGPGGEAVLLEIAPVQRIRFEGDEATLIVARNITTRKRLEQQLFLSDRMASLGALAAGVAHEINNPLAYVILNIDRIASALLSAERRAPIAWQKALGAARVADLPTWVEQAREGAERVRRIVRDLRTFSRFSPESTVPVDVRAALESAINIASNEVRYRARVVTEIRPCPPALADPGRLGQVFLNLLLNAAQSFDDSDVEENEIRIVLGEGPSGEVLVEISDNGPGMPPEVLARAFEPFFTTKPVGVGTGLGLPICQSILAALGGHITLESAVGLGTTVRVTLPPATGAIESIEAPESVTFTPPSIDVERRARILVVDDDERVARALRRALGGHDTTVASSGREAIAILDESEPFDVIFCDVMMPEAGGIEVYEHLRRQSPGIERRIVFMTGGAFTHRARDFLARVPNPCLEKPFDMETIQRVLERALGLIADVPSSRSPQSVKASSRRGGAAAAAIKPPSP